MNQKDQWKDFFDENRADFEQESPSGDLWDRIANDLPAESSGKMVPMRWMIAVAAACLIIGIPLGGFLFQGDQRAEAIAEVESITEDSKANVETTFGAFSDELREVEHHYQQEIDVKLVALQEYDVEDEWLEALNLLQVDFESLKQALDEGANREKVIEAMIQNYRIQLELLEELLEEYEENEITVNA